MNIEQNFGSVKLSSLTQNSSVPTVEESGGGVLVTILSIPKRTLERDLSVLQKAKVIRHEGSDKSGIWVVLEPYNSKE